MKPFIRHTLERQRLRLHELDALLGAPDAVADRERFRQLSREHAEADAVVQPYLRYLERAIREGFGFGSTPLKLRVRRKGD